MGLKIYNQNEEADGLTQYEFSSDLSSINKNYIDTGAESEMYSNIFGLGKKDQARKKTRVQANADAKNGGQKAPISALVRPYSRPAIF